MPAIRLSDVQDLIPIALACFVLAYGESISVARSFAKKHDYDISPEQELTALGAANIATGLAHRFPVAGGMSQTAVNDMGGASTSFSLVVTSGAIALTLLLFAPFFHNLPEPVLAAVVLMAAAHLVRIADLRELRLVSRSEFRISLLAAVAVLFFGLLDGLLLAAIGSLVVVIARASQPSVVVLEREPSTGNYVNRARYPEASETRGVLVVRSAGAWFYFNAEYIRRRIVELIDKAPAGLRTVVIDCSIVPAIDPIAAESLRALAKALKPRGIGIALAERRDDVVDSLKLVGLEDELGPIAAHRRIEDCAAG